MGMFDELKCLYPLPDDEVQDQWFQTKNLECLMDRYTITKDGRLILHKVRYELVPEEERKYYGTPEWDESPLAQMLGMLRSVPVGDIDLQYHGEIIFYTSTGSHEDGDFRWYEYAARFNEGQLTRVYRIDKPS